MADVVDVSNRLLVYLLVLNLPVVDILDVLLVHVLISASHRAGSSDDLTSIVVEFLAQYPASTSRKVVVDCSYTAKRGLF